MSIARLTRPGVLVVVCLLVALPFAFRGLAVHDEGNTVYLASRVAQGEALYRDYSMPITPALYWVLAGLMRLFGHSLLVSRGLATVFGIANCLLIFAIGQRLWPGRDAFLGALCFAFWGTLQLNFARASAGAGVASLASVYLVLLHLQRGSPAALACAGAASGCAFLFKQNLGPAPAAAALASILIARGTGLFRPAPGQVHGQAEPSWPRRSFALSSSLFLAALALKAYWLAGAAAAGAVGSKLCAVRQAAFSGVRAQDFKRGLVECLLFLAGAAAPCLLVFLACWHGGYARAMMSDVFGLATRFVSVTPGRGLTAAGFICERLLNLAYLAGGLWALWASVRESRLGRRFESACFASAALAVAVLQVYGVEAEVMSLVSLWRFYDPTFLLCASSCIVLAAAAMAGLRGAQALHKRRLWEGLVLLSVAGVLVSSRAFRSPGRVAAVVAAAKYFNPWGLLLLPLALAAGTALLPRHLRGKELAITPERFLIASLAFLFTCASLVASQHVYRLVEAAPCIFCLASWAVASIRPPAAKAALVLLVCSLGASAAIGNRSGWYGPSARTSGVRTAELAKQCVPVGSPRAAHIRVEAGLAHGMAETAAYMAEHTTPTDSVCVWGDNTLLYFLADRKFDSPEFDIFKIAIPDRRELMLRRLRDASLVVVEKWILREPADSPLRSPLPILQAEFSREKEIGPYVVFRRRRTSDGP